MSADPLSVVQSIHHSESGTSRVDAQKSGQSQWAVARRGRNVFHGPIEREGYRRSGRVVYVRDVDMGGVRTIRAGDDRADHELLAVGSEPDIRREYRERDRATPVYPNPATETGGDR